MQYSLKQAEQIVGIPAAAIRQLVADKVITPQRGIRRSLRFSFQDLIVLRLAKGLHDAGIGPRRIARALAKLRRQLPPAPPLGGLRIAALGDEIIVSDGGTPWQAADGQYLLAYEFRQPAGELAHFAPPSSPTPPVPPAAAESFQRGLALEERDPQAAMAFYRQAMTSGDCPPGASINLGRLLHEAGRLAEAEAVYEQAMAAHPDEPLLLFNFAVLREDQRRHDEAIMLYEAALQRDPKLRDAHYNLALLWQSAGRAAKAVRHFNAYRRLTGSQDA